MLECFFSGISEIDRGSMRSFSLTQVCVRAGYKTQRGIGVLRDLVKQCGLHSWSILSIMSGS